MLSRLRTRAGLRRKDKANRFHVHLELQRCTMGVSRFRIPSSTVTHTHTHTHRHTHTDTHTQTHTHTLCRPP